MSAPGRAPLEVLRQRLDPAQAALIPAHVTLCREDELSALDVDALVTRIHTWPHGTLTLAFGAPQRFQGHGVLLPGVQGDDAFQRLRQWLLADPAARVHHAHLTLAHPRNPRAPGNTDAALAGVPTALRLGFAQVALVQQAGAEPWQVLWQAPLGGLGHVLPGPGLLG
ncbi:MAG: 2'-5' RNA ligase family protein [Rubrivivax sp.]|nr:2'-5' RNA ligase family protein [Rubrivivax sp.]